MPLLTLQDALEYYRDYALGVEGRSDKTVAFKEVPARQLIEYLGSDVPLAELREQHLVGFFGWLRQRPKWDHHPSGNRPQGQLQDISLNTYYRGLRALFNWLAKRAIIEASPMANIEEPGYMDKLPRHLHFDQVQRILRAIDQRTHTGCRDAAIILLMLDVRARAGEVTNLRLADVDIRNRELLLTRRKIKKQQVIGFRGKPAGLLATYAMHWRPASNHEVLFLTEDGRPLSVGRLDKILRARGEKVGIHLNPHLLRHTAAVLKRRLEGWDAERIQNLLGHSSPAMTRRYIQAAGDEDLREAFRKPGWVDKLKI